MAKLQNDKNTFLEKRWRLSVLIWDVSVVRRCLALLIYHKTPQYLNTDIVLRVKCVMLWLGRTCDGALSVTTPELWTKTSGDLNKFYRGKEKYVLGIWCMTCQHCRVISLVKNCWRPFHIFNTSLVGPLAVNRLLFFQRSAKEFARSKIQYVHCFTYFLHVLFIFKLLRLVLYIWVTASPLWLLSRITDLTVAQKEQVTRAHFFKKTVGSTFLF